MMSTTTNYFPTSIPSGSGTDLRSHDSLKLTTATYSPPGMILKSATVHFVASFVLCLLAFVKVQGIGQKQTCQASVTAVVLFTKTNEKLPLTLRKIKMESEEQKNAEIPELNPAVFSWLSEFLPHQQREQDQRTVFQVDDVLIWIKTVIESVRQLDYELQEHFVNYPLKMRGLETLLRDRKNLFDYFLEGYYKVVQEVENLAQGRLKKIEDLENKESQDEFFKAAPFLKQVFESMIDTAIRYYRSQIYRVLLRVRAQDKTLFNSYFQNFRIQRLKPNDKKSFIEVKLKKVKCSFGLCSCYTHLDTFGFEDLIHYWLQSVNREDKCGHRDFFDAIFVEYNRAQTKAVAFLDPVIIKRLHKRIQQGDWKKNQIFIENFTKLNQWHERKVLQGYGALEHPELFSSFQPAFEEFAVQDVLDHALEFYSNYFKQDVFDMRKWASVLGEYEFKAYSYKFGRRDKIQVAEVQEDKELQGDVRLVIRQIYYNYMNFKKQYERETQESLRTSLNITEENDIPAFYYLARFKAISMSEQYENNSPGSFLISSQLKVDQAQKQYETRVFQVLAEKVKNDPEWLEQQIEQLQQIDGEQQYVECIKDKEFGVKQFQIYVGDFQKLLKDASGIADESATAPQENTKKEKQNINRYFKFTEWFYKSITCQMQELDSAVFNWLLKLLPPQEYQKQNQIALFQKNGDALIWIKKVIESVRQLDYELQEHFVNQPLEMRGLETLLQNINEQNLFDYISEGYYKVIQKVVKLATRMLEKIEDMEKISKDKYKTAPFLRRLFENMMDIAIRYYMLQIYKVLVRVSIDKNLFNGEFDQFKQKSDVQLEVEFKDLRPSTMASLDTEIIQKLHKRIQEADWTKNKTLIENFTKLNQWHERIQQAVEKNYVEYPDLFSSFQQAFKKFAVQDVTDEVLEFPNKGPHDKQ